MPNRRLDSYEVYAITEKTKELVRLALEEDIGQQDITTDALVSKKMRGSAVIIVKEEGIMSGRAITEEIFRTVDRRTKVRWFKKDGVLLKPGDVICRISGSLHSILKAERVALNFLGRFSGVATLTRKFVEKVHGTKAKIYDTRKTMPLWRRLEKHSVRMGGGCNHRMGLWDQGLIKDNHWEIVRDGNEMAKVIQKNNHKKWTVEISKDNFSELEKVLRVKPDVILLDNFSPRELKQIVRRIRSRYQKGEKRPLLEASGGIDLRTVRRVAMTGVDRISVGAITHSVRALDFSLKIQKLSK